jgi:hypothetical protein
LFLKYWIIAKHEAKTTRRVAYLTAILFAIHWTLFHLAEIVIITNISFFQISSLFSSPPTTQFAIALVIVFLMQAIAFFTKGYARAMEEENQKELQEEMKDSFVGPYSMIVPNQLALVLMLITIAASTIVPTIVPTLSLSFTIYALVFVMLLKTLGSLYIYIREEAI